MKNKLPKTTKSSAKFFQLSTSKDEARKHSKGIVNNNNVWNHAQMYFLALYLKKHIELILLCCVYSAININFGGIEIKGA